MNSFSTSLCGLSPLQDVLFHQTELLKFLYAGNHSGQSISLIIYNASIWTGDDKVVQDNNKDALFSYAVLVHRHLSACQQTLHCPIASCVAKFLLQVSSAEALAVQSNGSIVAVGSSAEVLLLQQPATQVTNLQGAFVMPASPFHTMYCYTASQQCCFC